MDMDALITAVYLQLTRGDLIRKKKMFSKIPVEQLLSSGSK